MRWALLVLLLVGPVAGQSFEQTPVQAEAAHAPVQLVLDQFPRFVDLAIAEATFDGTPDDAQALVVRMQTFFAGFRAAAPWPDESEAARTDARASFAVVEQMLGLAERLPAEVAVLARVEAACHAARNVPSGQLETWWMDAFAGATALDVVHGGLHGLAEAVPPALSAAPVRQALASLEAWLAQVVPDVDACLQEVAVRQSMAAPPGLQESVAGQGQDYLRLLVSPSPVQLGQDIRISGRLVGPSGVVRVAAPGLLDIEVVPAEDGRFALNHTIVRSTPLGPHVVRASAGALAAEAGFEVVRATVQLHLSAPAEALPGQTVRIDGGATSALPFAGSARLDLDGASILPAGGSIQRTAPERGTMRIVLTFAGDATHAPAQTEVTIRVVVPAQTADDPRWELLEKGVWYEPSLQGGGNGGVLQRPGVATGALLAIAAAVVTFITIDLALSGRRAPLPPAAAPVPAMPTTAWPRSFVRAFSALAGWLVAKRRLRPGATPRDVGRHLEASGVPPGRLVAEFEMLRYGGRGMPVEMARQRSRWTRRLWQRLGGR